ncbi:MAG: hypothetical protein LBT54_04575 [Bifidobacteriaceae bacterium]|jgi:hypothetical protein|nr:hypothetical protein [Bifidobacteriaceae bacterium]
MRTTVDLPPAVRLRVEQLAEDRGLSLSATVAELTIRGLAGLGDALSVSTDPITGFPVLGLGRPITSEDVAAALDEA